MKTASKTLVFTATALLSLSYSPYVLSASPETQISDIELGKILAFQQKKGNCLACHAIKGGKLPGNIGPPLINMKQRYPNKTFLNAQIADATENNPHSIMPPFKKHRILSDTELKQVVEFVYSL